MPELATFSMGIDPVSRLNVAPKQLDEFCRKWKISEMSFFGSILRDDFRPDSDVDFLIEFEQGAKWSLLEYVAMEEEMAEMVGRPVDMIERRAVESSENYLRKRHILEHPETTPQLDEHILLDILIAARQAMRFMEGITRTTFAGNDLLQSALLRNLSIIGRATRKLSPKVKHAHPGVAWNKLVHVPPGGWVWRHTSEDRLWATVTSDLPQLVRAIEPLVLPEEEA